MTYGDYDNMVHGIHEYLKQPRHPKKYCKVIQLKGNK